MLDAGFCSVRMFLRHLLVDVGTEKSQQNGEKDSVAAGLITVIRPFGDGTIKLNLISEIMKKKSENPRRVCEYGGFS